jgi:hypothetical protein
LLWWRLLRRDLGRRPIIVDLLDQRFRGCDAIGETTTVFPGSGGSAALDLWQ